MSGLPHHYKTDPRTGLILGENEVFRGYMDTRAYWAHPQEELSATSLFNEFQNILQNILEKAVNGMYFQGPIYGKSLRRLQRKVDYLMLLLGRMDTETGLGMTNVGDTEITERSLFSVLSLLYRVYLDLESHILRGNHFGSRNRKMSFVSRSVLKHDDATTSPLSHRFRRICESHLSAYIVGMFLHGSLATLDYTPYSDVDTLILIKDSTLFEPDRLCSFSEAVLRLVRCILGFDHLQHHGCFLVPEAFMAYYSQAYMPVVVFERAKLIHPQEVEFCLKERSSTLETKRSLWRITQTLRRINLQPGSQPRSLYELKHVLSQFMLLPSLYLQLTGRYVCKKYSFEAVRGEFREQWPVMDKVSEIRNKWERPDSAVFKCLLNSGLNPWLVSGIYRRLKGGMPDWLADDLNDGFYSDMLELSERMLERVCQ